MCEATQSIVNDESVNTIYISEADEDLEKEQSSSLVQSLAEFKEKGGTLIRLEDEATPFQFEQGDVVFPSCSGANNRSQTLWATLRPYSEKIVLMAPHATRYGFDPYNGKSNWNRTHHVQKNDEFIHWAGVYKTKKFGWNIFESMLSVEDVTEDERQVMWQYYSDNYYSPEVTEGTRKVYITFTKNAHVHLYRLNQTNVSLENVIVLFYPVEDLIAKPLKAWETHPRSIKAYTELSKIILNHLDFDKL